VFLWLGVDAQMLKSAISADELTEWLRPIDAGQMIFILDSCEMGIYLTQVPTTSCGFQKGGIAEHFTKDL
jgi:hypothetical protein